MLPIIIPHAQNAYLIHAKSYLMAGEILKEYESYLSMHSMVTLKKNHAPYELLPELYLRIQVSVCYSGYVQRLAYFTDPKVILACERTVLYSTGISYGEYWYRR